MKIELTESQITILRLLLLEEKLAAQGHVRNFRPAGNLLEEVEDLLEVITTPQSERIRDAFKQASNQEAA